MKQRDLTVTDSLITSAELMNALIDKVNELEETVNKIIERKGEPE